MKYLNLFFLITFFYSSIALSSSVVNYNGNYIGIPNAPSNYNLNWNKSSGVYSEQYICIVGFKYSGYYNRNNSNSNNDINRYHYGWYKKKSINVDLKAYGLNTYNSSLGSFTMRNSNNNFLRYNMEVYDYNKSSYKELKQNNYTKDIKGLIDCDGNNAYKQSLKVTVNLEDLQNIPSGTYWDLVYLTAGDKNLAYTQDLFYVSIKIEGGRIQINQLDDIDFGLYKLGQGDLSVTEQFCVHQSPSSNYNISIYDSYRGRNGNNFNLYAGNESIPYKVYYRTTRTGFYKIENGSTIGSFKSNSVVNCTNSEYGSEGEKAYIKIEIKENDLIKSSPELYKGILYITASPE